MQAAVRTAELLKEQSTDVKNALKTNSGPDSVSKLSDAVDREITDVLRKLRGDPDATAVSDDKRVEDPSIQERVNNVAEEIGNVTSEPTELQRATLTLATSDLQREVGFGRAVGVVTRLEARAADEDLAEPAHRPR